VSEICKFALDNILPLFNDTDPTIQTLALLCVSSWSSHSTIETDLFFPTLEYTVQKLSTLSLIETTSEVIMNLLSDSRISGLEKTVMGQIYPELISLNGQLAQCIKQEEEDFISPFCKLLSKFGEVFVTFLVENLPSSRPYFDMLLSCTAYCPLYPSTSEISEIPFYFWFVFSNELETTNELKPTSLSPATLDLGRQILHQLLHVLINQSKYPDDEVISLWTSDDIDRIRNHRRECADTSLYCYYALELGALEMIVTSIINEMGLLNSDSNAGLQVLETLMFHLKSFAESVPAEEESYTVMIFQDTSMTFLQGLATSSRNGSKYFRLTLASLMGKFKRLILGNFAEWLAFHPTALPLCVNYLVTEITDSHNPIIAASSLVEVCATCQGPLAQHCDEVLNLCIAALSTCSTFVKSKIFLSISHIVKALPPSEATPRMSLLLGGIIDQLGQDVGSLSNGIAPNLNQIESILMHLEFLESFSKGGNSYLHCDLTETTTITPEEMQLGSRFYTIVEAIMNTIREEVILQELAVAIKDCARAGLPLFQSQTLPLFFLIGATFKSTKQSYWMSSFTQLFRKINWAAAPYEPITIQIMDISNFISTEYSSLQSMENNPDIIHEYFLFLTEVILAHSNPKVLQNKKDIIEQFPANIMEGIFGVCLINGLYVQEPLAVNAVLTFLHDFINQSTCSTLPSICTHILQAICRPLLEAFLKSVAGGHPSSMLPKMCKGMLLVMNAYPDASRSILTDLLSQTMGKATPMDSQVFLRGILGFVSLSLLTHKDEKIESVSRGLQSV
jgi:hypothetical protein